VLYTDVWGLQPGIQPVAETYENAFRWGPAGQGLITGGTISTLASDPGNSPTYELRPGLVLGQRTADGTWTNYSPANTDGSEVAAGVLLTSIRLQSILTGQNQARFYGVLVGGPVQAAKLFGLDLMARADMSDHFWFDDALNLPGNHWFPYRRFQNKTANYSIVPSDNFTVFDNTGASGEVDLTLPAIANGYYFALKCMTATVFKFISNEGGNVIGDTLTRSNVSVTAVGGGLKVYTNAAGTKWYVENASSGSQTVSYG